MNSKERKVILDDLQDYLTEALCSFGITMTQYGDGVLDIRTSLDYYFRFFVLDDGEIEDYRGTKITSISDPNYREKVEAFLIIEVRRLKLLQ